MLLDVFVSRAVVVGYNLPLLKNLGEDLILDLEQLVGIYNGSIQWWNNTHLARHMNVSLPQQRINVCLPYIIKHVSFYNTVVYCIHTIKN